MGAPYHGDPDIFWCSVCGVPVLGKEPCTLCGGAVQRVQCTPPGELRPAHAADIDLINHVARSQFGTDALESKWLVLMNRAAGVERMEEFLVSGKPAGVIAYHPDRGWQLKPRLHLALHMALSATRGRVFCHEDAVPYLLRGASLLGPGVVGSDPDISPGDEVLVLSDSGKLVGTGAARKSSAAMATRGTSVKLRHHYRDRAREPERLSPKPAKWSDVLSANRARLESYIHSAVEFIRRKVSEWGGSVLVSHSGGKDSQATLELVLEAGVRPGVLFIDTGLELPGTREFVERVCEERGLELLVAEAKDAFSRNLPLFGPPGRDFRWCCKTCKLGPATRLIATRFPEGVLSFIGQRALESVQRARKGESWENPYVPGQMGVSPIQRWSSLHVWLYLMTKGLVANPWYYRGLDRIGCAICPASDLGDLEIVSHYMDISWFYDALHEYVERMGYPHEYVRYGLWRWRRSSGAWKALATGLGVELPAISPRTTQDDNCVLRYIQTSGINPCSGGYSIEGYFTGTVHMDILKVNLQIAGEVELIEGGLSVRDARTPGVTAEILDDGLFYVRGKDRDKVRQLSKVVRSIVVRSERCVGCGVCLGRCSRHALSIEGHRIVVNPEKCTSCRACLGPCPVLNFIR